MHALSSDRLEDTLAAVQSGRWLWFLPERFQRVGARLIIYGAAATLALLAAPLADRHGGEYLDASFKRTLAALAATRGLDSAISLAQSSEVSFSFGPGGSIGIGQVLDPVNDLVEQYGALLLTSTTALGIQQLGMRMGQALGWWMFVPALIAVMGSAAVRGIGGETLLRWGKRLFALALFARLAIPVTAWVDSLVAERFLEASYQQATAVVETTTENLQQVEAADAEKPWYERYNPVNVVGDRAKQMYDALGNVAESIVNLAIYFTISTVVLPLGTLWLLSKIVSGLFAARGG